MFLLDQKYRFVKVEDFFSNYKQWNHVQKIESPSDVTVEDTVISIYLKSDVTTHKMLIEFIRSRLFRVRFDPGVIRTDAGNAKDYTSENTRTIAVDSFRKLRKSKKANAVDFSGFKLQAVQKDGFTEITSIRSSGKTGLKLRIQYDPFVITVFGYDEHGEFRVLSTSKNGMYFTPSGFDNDYAVIQSMDKNPDAKFVGFGEQGGLKLCKNTTQLTYFNYDNMRYSQIYNNGPLEYREPLYHSDPFFLEVYGVPGRRSVYGIFVDNPSEVCMDIGYSNSSKYMFGTRFGSLEYYFIFGNTSKHVISTFTSIIGRSRLKPRYALGYHQGCYGYDTRDKVENCAREYAKADIPLDGIHVDVDVQEGHKPFTVDTNRFPDPAGMFSWLRSQGIKCSTNITPIVTIPTDGKPYAPYDEGIANGYFITDERADASDWDARDYYFYESGTVCKGHADNNFNSGKPYVGGINYGYDPAFQGHYPDLGRFQVRKWFGTLYQPLFDMGLEMVWQDMTTPAIQAGLGDMKSFPARLKITNDFIRAFDDDKQEEMFQKEAFIRVWNLYSYNLHKATYYGLNYLKGREDKRNFIVGRGSFTGAHRFAALWTGDNSSTWEFLRINIAQCLALGLTGQAMAGEDIGGFEKGSQDEKWVDPELLIRWTLAGAFLPWFRNHYTGKSDAKWFQEPYQYARYRDYAPDNYKYMYDAVLPYCKFFIELRYRLLQLFYDRMFENTLNGMPICRPLFLTDEDYSLYNDKTQFLSNQFMVGDDLLVAPVLEKGKSRRDIYLPVGSNWYAFKDNRWKLDTPVEGGTTLNYDAHITSGNPAQILFALPVYIREGAVIPTIQREKYVGQFNAEGRENPITLNIYPSANTRPKAYDMYLDDGVSRSSAASTPIHGDEAAADKYRHVRVSHAYDADNAKQRIVTVERVHDAYTPLETYFYVAVLHQGDGLLSVEINGMAAPVYSGGNVEERSSRLGTSSENAWYHNENIDISFIKVFDNNSKLTIRLIYA